MKKIILAFIVTLCFSCKETPKTPVVEDNTPKEGIRYAKGFTLEKFGENTVINISNPWPGADKTYRYILVKDKATFSTQYAFDAIVEVPVKSMVVTSTTHIPSLEQLGVLETLKGFPNLDYISSEATRKLISEEKIIELGKNEDLNTEVLIDLAPDAVVGFAVDGNNDAFRTLRHARIPMLYNSDWTETHPLGKAEWIKFFGVLYGKEQQADSIFNQIEKSYLEAKAVAAKASKKPTVLSGAMYKDVWYLPQGDSWAAQFIADANGDYLWHDSEGTGSLSLNLEAVLDKAQQAEFWIGPGQFTSLSQLEETHSVYQQFDAFKNKTVFSSTNNTGATGGVLYYELAPNRPDIVLKDIIKILHPSLLPDHKLFFFSKLQ